MYRVIYIKVNLSFHFPSIMTSENYDDYSSEKSFYEFLAPLLNRPKDPTTTIIRQNGQCYKLEPNTNERKKFFKFLNELKDDELSIIEKQTERSALMVDVDMYFKSSQVVIKPKHRKDFVDMISTLMFECFEIDKIHQAVIIKPQRETLKKCEENKYKDGFHILAPSVLMTKDMRRFFLHQLKERLQQLPSFREIKFIGDLKIFLI